MKMLIYGLLMLLSISIYFQAFFPTPKTMNYPVKPPGKIDNTTLNITSFYHSRHEKTVIILIDALRLDFVTPSSMPYVWKMHKTNGCLHTVKVEVPTVTMPRIKALTMGNIPQFVDVLTNLAGNQPFEDSLLHRAVAQNRNIIFYGDDTWIKLFPNSFKRSEGTTSFFVNDFHEVDRNVTRNMRREMQENDWDIMILHYLGLDHIGHVLGPKHPLILEKLKEMDDTIAHIHQKLQTMPGHNLLMVTADHGMKDGGGHGGSSFAERHIPLILSGLPCLNGQLNQIDIPTNLAVLLGLDIPSTSIGILNPNLLKSLNNLDYLYALRYNYLVLQKKIDLCDNFGYITQQHGYLSQGLDPKNGLEIQNFYENCSEITSKHLMNSLVLEGDLQIVFAILLSFILFFMILSELLSVQVSPCIICILLCVSIVNFWYFTKIFLILALIIWGIILMKLLKTPKKWINSGGFIYFLISTIILHPFTFFSSSLIEEEHQFWYFMTSILFLLSLILYSKKLHTFLVLIGIRCLRFVNQTGDKWAALPDLSDWLMKDENQYYLYVFFLISLILVDICCYSTIRKYRVNTSLTLALIFWFRVGNADAVLMGKIVWATIIFHLLFNRKNLANLAASWLLICGLLFKPYNVILISSAYFANWLSVRLFEDVVQLVIVHIFLENCLIFMQGHSNSLANIDISCGYIGLNSYQPPIVFLQILSHAYGLPILLRLLLLRNSNGKLVFKLIFLQRLFVLTIVMFITFLFRDHLFIWSVFAPKLFIEFSHSMVFVVELFIYYLVNLLK